MLASLATYFILLLCISRRSRGTGGNDDFFRAARNSPWGMVAFGMIGASVSGVSLVSVPGWVGATRMTYLQMCLGFVLGYVAVAFVLLPLYYRLRLTSIYSYLGQRFGERARHTGAFFFLLSKLTGAAARLYLAAVVIAAFLPWAFPGHEVAVAALALLLIYLYTRWGGIRTLVRTDALQTGCMLAAIVGLLWAVADRMGLDAGGMVQTIRESPLSQVFEWDWRSPGAFWRQFLSGVFIVIVMTGLDQDMMQKNLTCRSLRDAQKDMCAYGLAFVPVNLLLLSLGVLLHAFCTREGIVPPARGDELLPSLVAGGTLGSAVVIPFSIGIVAAAFSSADSALTSLTTSLCIDILHIEECQLPEKEAKRLRRRVHLGVCAAFLACILLFRAANSRSVIDAIYVMASYTYGPLLGLYAFGIFTRRTVPARPVPYIAVAAPLVCALLDAISPALWGYKFGYELLLLNGALTFCGLWLSSNIRRTSA